MQVREFLSLGVRSCHPEDTLADALNAYGSYSAKRFPLLTGTANC